VSFFLTLALNPLVEALTRRGLRGPFSVTIVFIGLVGVFTALGVVVVPPVAEQGGLLADNAPKYLDNLLNNRAGFFSFSTVLVLTLYFLSSLPKVKHAAYGMVPPSRRLRFVSLSEEIMGRVGGYAIGLVAVATIKAICSYIMMVDR
jgi:predicted PurR-regulated permease PerM